jgi:hypothetical protein
MLATWDVAAWAAVTHLDPIIGNLTFTKGP